MTPKGQMTIVPTTTKRVGIAYRRSPGSEMTMNDNPCPERSRRNFTTELHRVISQRNTELFSRSKGSRQQ